MDKQRQQLEKNFELCFSPMYKGRRMYPMMEYQVKGSTSFCKGINAVFHLDE
jgi:hypothetical protein